MINKIITTALVIILFSCNTETKKPRIGITGIAIESVLFLQQRHMKKILILNTEVKFLLVIIFLINHTLTRSIGSLQ